MDCMNHYTIVSLFLFIIVITTSAAKRCPLSARTERIVKQCPENQESTNTSSKLKNCERLAKVQTCTSPSKFKYHCLPTDLSGTLVEVCAVEIYIYGVCVLYNNTELQIDESINCSQYSTCPDRFLSSEAHLYEPCQLIGLSSTIPSTKKTVTFIPEDDSEVYTTVYILVAVTGIILFCIGLVFFIIKKWKKSWNREG